ncbi:cobalamin-dependent protein, partial [Candidatus Sumerlaeota bacterium]|nr:cobalamin-dependent protein [Candidatus Sumerlaeota bacterium]
MRIFLCYPPLRPLNSREALARLDDRDNTEPPIGLHLLGAVLREQGHEVALENLALTPWGEALEAIESSQPELFGVSCYTFHRHTVAELTRAVRERCPETKIIAGGPHVSPMPEAILERWPWVDFVAVGESEIATTDLVRRLEREEPLSGLLGVAWRDESGSPVFEGRAAPIEDLDSLPIAARHWPHWIVSTSRGCPYACTFCSSPSVWGRKVRWRSPEHVIEELMTLRRAGLRQVAFKDETFTLTAQRVEAICQAIIDAGLDLWWSCDTRADCLDEERLVWLRRAGCYEISLGVESGSPEMIAFHNKRERPEDVVEATQMARRLGIQVRQYYILGAPGECERSVRDTAHLIERSRPQRVFLAPLSVLPGTELENRMRGEHGWDESIWFERTDEWILVDERRRYQGLKSFRKLRRFHNSGSDASTQGLLFPFTPEDLRGACERVPDAFAVHWDLGQHLMGEGRAAEASQSLWRALELRPGSGKGWIDLGLCLQALAQVDGALAAWQRVEGIADEIPLNRSVALLHRAQVLAQRGDVESALALCLRSMEIVPGQTEAHHLATQMLIAQRRAEEAEEIASRWIRQAPQDARAHSVIAGCCFLRGDLEGARLAFEGAQACAPASEEILTNLALVNLKLGRNDEAQ